jgi:hypothetical protein
MEGADLVRNHDSESLREGLRDAVHFTARVGTSLGSENPIEKNWEMLGSRSSVQSSHCHGR